MCGSEISCIVIFVFICMCNYNVFIDCVYLCVCIFMFLMQIGIHFYVPFMFSLVECPVCILLLCEQSGCVEINYGGLCTCKCFLQPYLLLQL